MRVAQIPDEYRRTGATTKQMQCAPERALFIWPVHSISYAKHLARHLGRDDLEIVGPSVLEDGAMRLRGRTFSAVILDHACEPDSAEFEALEMVRASIR